LFPEAAVEQDGLVLALQINRCNYEGLPSFAPPEEESARSSGAQVRLREFQLLHTRNINPIAWFQQRCRFLGSGRR
jgi:hypothetical protein